MMQNNNVGEVNQPKTYLFSLPTTPPIKESFHTDNISINDNIRPSYYLLHQHYFKCFSLTDLTQGEWKEVQTASPRFLPWAVLWVWSQGGACCSNSAERLLLEFQTQSKLSPLIASNQPQLFASKSHLETEEQNVTQGGSPSTHML